VPYRQRPYEYRPRSQSTQSRFRRRLRKNRWGWMCRECRRRRVKFVGFVRFPIFRHTSVRLIFHFHSHIYVLDERVTLRLPVEKLKRIQQEQAAMAIQRFYRFYRIRVHFNKIRGDQGPVNAGRMRRGHSSTLRPSSIRHLRTLLTESYNFFAFRKKQVALISRAGSIRIQRRNFYRLFGARRRPHGHHDRQPTIVRGHGRYSR
jgi:hypothetical protein